jgi:hypothetical protein
VGSGLEKTQWGQVLYSYISLAICLFPHQSNGL